MKKFYQAATGAIDHRLRSGMLKFPPSICWANRRYVPIDNNSSRASGFVMINNENHGLMKDSTKFFVSHKNTSWFNVRNRMSPSVFVHVCVGAYCSRYYFFFGCEWIFACIQICRANFWLIFKVSVIMNVMDVFMITILGRENGSNGLNRNIIFPKSLKRFKIS